MIALIVQVWLIPLRAAPQFGLLVNQGDLEIYRGGALQVLHDATLYSEPIPPGGWFTYPPFAALFFVPLAVIPLTAAKVAVFVVSGVALWATLWRSCRALGYRGGLDLAVACGGLALVALDLESVRGTLWQDQINLILMAVIVWDLTRPPTARFRGWTIGLAAGVKLTAVVFVPYLVLTRQWRAAVSATVTAVLTVAAGWLIIPADSRDYWFDAVHDVDRIGPVTHPLDQSINGVLANLWSPSEPPVAVWLLLVAVAAVLGYAAATTAHRAGQSLLGIVIVGLLGCAVPPLAWSHHWVWIAPLLIILLHKTIQAREHRGAWILLTSAVFAAASMWCISWIFAEITDLGLTSEPGYIPAMTAAVEHMPTWARVIACGVPPLIYLGVVVTTLSLTLRGGHRPSGAGTVSSLERQPR
ncbi:glycosyltransferase 87 family protein [Nocardia jejuensis]|uniref:glycosyltransferase 87 family protein n=1 Tax=Nocardia jejuensis TaxID=328049 RepID=UPI001472110E|nr:glycosyltransferase 87 family protein [Nocardia jejuensis]